MLEEQDLSTGSARIRIESSTSSRFRTNVDPGLSSVRGNAQKHVTRYFSFHQYQVRE